MDKILFHNLISFTLWLHVYTSVIEGVKNRSAISLSLGCCTVGWILYQLVLTTQPAFNQQGMAFELWPRGFLVIVISTYFVLASLYVILTRRVRQIFSRKPREDNNNVLSRLMSYQTTKRGLVMTSCSTLSYHTIRGRTSVSISCYLQQDGATFTK